MVPLGLFMWSRDSSMLMWKTRNNNEGWFTLRGGGGGGSLKASSRHFYLINYLLLQKLNFHSGCKKSSNYHKSFCKTKNCNIFLRNLLSTLKAREPLHTTVEKSIQLTDGAFNNSKHPPVTLWGRGGGTRPWPE